MTVRRAEMAVLLEDHCPVEDAETLLQELHAGAVLVDWSGCTHLHAACLQIILAAGLPVRGLPANAALQRWAPSILQAAPSTVQAGL